MKANIGTAELELGAKPKDIQQIPARLTEVFERARRENRPTSAVADQLARERIGRGAPRMVA